MRVITEFFTIESQRLVLDHPVDRASNDSIPITVKDVINAHREWFGMHEGENRAAILEKSIPSRRPRHKKSNLKVLFSIVLIDRTTNGHPTPPTNEW
jgi:hypothetical protein